MTHASPYGTGLFKRGIDFVAAALLLVALSPLLVLLALLVRWQLGAPVLFKQSRPGLGGRAFTMRKFRSMRDALGPDGKPLADAARLNRFGRLLRASSLDELPELWNVLVGEMSLVGPRPLLTEYLPLYSPEQMRRHLVRPGITGWAQVNGRNSVAWPQRLAYDVWYVDHCSLSVDVVILMRTVGRVLRRDGIAAIGHETMPHFRGER